MNFIVKLSILEEDKLTSIFGWLDSEIGKEDNDWSWDVTPSWRSDGFDFFYFKNEEDKFKFILKWV